MTSPSDIPVRGTLTPDRPLDSLTWLRVGGPADWLFQPADEDDLAAFLSALPPDYPVFPMGVGSNLIVRDGGLRAVVIRLGRGFNAIEIAATASPPAPPPSTPMSPARPPRPGSTSPSCAPSPAPSAAPSA
jgi:hypothetical protein